MNQDVSNGAKRL